MQFYSEYKSLSNRDGTTGGCGTPAVRGKCYPRTCTHNYHLEVLHLAHFSENFKSLTATKPPLLLQLVTNGKDEGNQSPDKRQWPLRARAMRWLASHMSGSLGYKYPVP